MTSTTSSIYDTWQVKKAHTQKDLVLKFSRSPFVLRTLKKLWRSRSIRVGTCGERLLRSRVRLALHVTVQPRDWQTERKVQRTDGTRLNWNIRTHTVRQWGRHKTLRTYACAFGAYVWEQTQGSVVFWAASAEHIHKSKKVPFLYNPHDWARSVSHRPPDWRVNWPERGKTSSRQKTKRAPSAIRGPPNCCLFLLLLTLYLFYLCINPRTAASFGSICTRLLLPPLHVCVWMALPLLFFRSLSQRRVQTEAGLMKLLMWVCRQPAKSAVNWRVENGMISYFPSHPRQQLFIVRSCFYTSAIRDERIVNWQKIVLRT